jgi:DNA-directed RNA polymerase subunit M/transcription elongation factor TFIIS
MNTEMAFSTVLKNEKNCQILEKCINQHVKSEDDRKWFTYQTIGFLIKDIKKLKKIGSDVKAGAVGWKSPTYNDIEKKIIEFDDYLVKPFEVVEGVSECSKCHSKKTWSVQKQTRSSDEPMTTFTNCVDCGHRWSYSG